MSESVIRVSKKNRFLQALKSINRLVSSQIKMTKKRKVSQSPRRAYLVLRSNLNRENLRESLQVRIRVVAQERRMSRPIMIPIQKKMTMKVVILMIQISTHQRRSLFWMRSNLPNRNLKGSRISQEVSSCRLQTWATSSKGSRMTKMRNSLTSLKPPHPIWSAMSQKYLSASTKSWKEIQIRLKRTPSISARTMPQLT